MPSIADALEELNDKAMTRKEQIKEYLLTIGNGEMTGIPFDVGFECGVEWADIHPHWISVEDKPRENGFYLCYSDKEKAYEILSLYGAYWYDAYGHYIPSCDVTHWMPLPQPPKERR